MTGRPPRPSHLYGGHGLKTGTDTSLRVCREEGYAVVEHGRRPMEASQVYSLTVSNPQHWPGGYLRPRTPKKLAYSCDVYTSYADMWETFESKGQCIKDFCDFKNCPFPSPTENPSYGDFVALAQTIIAYCGELP